MCLFPSFFSSSFSFLSVLFLSIGFFFLLSSFFYFILFFILLFLFHVYTTRLEYVYYSLHTLLVVTGTIIQVYMIAAIGNVATLFFNRLVQFLVRVA